jgi:hypothetical protein
VIKDASLVRASKHGVSVEPHSSFGAPNSKYQILSPLTGVKCFGLQLALDGARALRIRPSWSSFLQCATFSQRFDRFTKKTSD